MIILLGIGLILSVLFPLRLVTPAILFANSTPMVIPGLREWQGSSGSFMIDSASRIAVDPSYAAQLQDTAQVFHNDLSAATGYALPIAYTNSPALGDFFL